jgi:hypothetical protein
MFNLHHDETFSGVFWVICYVWCFWCVSSVVCQHSNKISMSSVVWVSCYVWCLDQCGCEVLCKTLRQFQSVTVGTWNVGCYVSLHVISLSISFYYVSNE